MKKTRDFLETGLKQQTAGRIKRLGGYLARTLANAPRRASRDSKSQYAEAPANHVYFPSADGGPIIDSGMTVEEYLKHIKNYRAKGYGTRNRQRKTGGRYAATRAGFKRDADGKRIWEKAPRPTGEIFTQGTGRNSDKEKEKISRLRDRERKLKSRLRRSERAEIKRATRQLRRLTSAKRVDLDAVHAAMQSHTSKLEAKRQQNAARLRDFREKHVRYRIVDKGAGFTAYPMKNTPLRKGGSDRPKTWRSGDSAGAYDNWLAKNWEVVELPSGEMEIGIRPETSAAAGFLKRLEYGGSFKTKSVVRGYLAYIEDNTQGSFRHRRVSFVPLYTDPRTVSVRGMHWVEAAVQRVAKRNEK